MPRSEAWDDSNGSPLIKYEKHWQKHSSYQIWDIAFLYIANYYSQLQRTQNTLAGYVLGRYAKESDFITTLGWLPVQELMEFAIVKCTFSALNDPKWLKYVPIKFQEKNAQYVLKTKWCLNVVKKNTFGDQAHDIFNDLPKTMSN